MQDSTSKHSLLGYIYIHFYLHAVPSHSSLEDQKDQVVVQLNAVALGLRNMYSIRGTLLLASGARLRQSCGAVAPSPTHLIILRTLRPSCICHTSALLLHTLVSAMGSQMLLCHAPHLSSFRCICGV